MTEPTSMPTPTRRIPRASLVLLVVALPVCLLADLPLAGWGTAAGLWVAGTLLHVWSRGLAAHGSPNAAIGLAAVAMFARMGIAMAVLLFLGGSATIGDSTLGAGRPDAAIVALVLYTLVFTLDMGERIGSDMSTRHEIAAAREEGS